MSALDSDRASAPRLADLSVGDALPTMHKFPDEAQLFLYSAASHNPHRIHYDREYARFEGHEDIIVHGPLQGAWLTQYVTDWAGSHRTPAGSHLAEPRQRALTGEELVYLGDGHIGGFGVGRRGVGHRRAHLRRKAAHAGDS